MADMIVASALTKRFGGFTALDRADITIGEGITGLLGSNGAGKSTLIKLVLGLLTPDGGSVHALGSDAQLRRPEVVQRIGYAPEGECFPSDVRAQDLVRHIGEVQGLPTRVAINRASDVLQHVGLGEERFRPIGTMSTGQKQRVKLAATIVHDPQIVLLDEPTNGLDPMQRDIMLELVPTLWTSFGMSVVLCSHLLQEVERVCGHVVMLDGGKVVAQGELTALQRGDQGFVFQVGHNVGAVCDLLVAKGYPAAPTPDGVIEIRSDSPCLGNDIRDAVADAGASLIRLEPIRVSIESLFFTAGSEAA
ncbi:MAG: ABC transporter ATP-binding protein [Actinobacteria bacterium]|nr:ABC transporter ATP-binding protein [Actinomycetota bacterium]MCB9389310.1 ABC transporter ATP-binding protein [Acidimicrobiia bacterium]